MKQSWRAETRYNYVGFEVFTAVVMKNIIFWDMTPCSPLIFNGRLLASFLNLFLRP
jgi:hypothetical protein